VFRGCPLLQVGTTGTEKEEKKIRKKKRRKEEYLL
jgi:hypothetical protein